MRDSFECAGLSMQRLWHCFGNAENHISIEIVQELLRVSGTNVLPINTHGLMQRRGDRVALEIGYGGVTYDALAEALDLTPYIRMLNVNLATDPHEAVDRARRARQLSGERVLKLEVLNADRAMSNDEGLLTAVAVLSEPNDGFVIMPLISTNVEAARALVDLGCPLLRVMGSAIGSCDGISDPEAFERICALGVPVMLDGGVGSPDDYHAALRCGASGALINSVLFAGAASPPDVMREFVSAVRRAEYSRVT